MLLQLYGRLTLVNDAVHAFNIARSFQVHQSLNNLSTVTLKEHVKKMYKIRHNLTK